MTRLAHSSYLLREERLAGQLRVIGAAVLVVMSALFDPLAGWAPPALAAVAVLWTVYLAWTTGGGRRVGPRAVHWASPAVDVMLAMTCYLVFLRDPEATPTLLFPIVIFRLTARYGRIGSVAGLFGFGVILAARAVVRMQVFGQGPVRPALLLVWALAATVTVALGRELRAGHREHGTGQDGAMPAASAAAAPAAAAEAAGARAEAVGAVGAPAAAAEAAPAENDLAGRLAVSLDPAQTEHVLTRREREVFLLLGQGASCREIAARLHVTTSTVRNHVYNMRVKLGLESRDDLIVLANEVLSRRPAGMSSRSS